MSIKKYRLCLVWLLVVVIILGAVLLKQVSKEESSYKDGIMVWNICEEYVEDVA